MDEPRDELQDLRHENRRLRQILDAMTRAGLGTGALVEVYAHENEFGVVVCRADRDEVAFLRDVDAGIRALLDIVGATPTGRAVRRGVTTSDPHQDGG